MKTKQKALVLLSPGFPADEADSTFLPAHQVFVKAMNRNFPEVKLIILAFYYPYKIADYDWHGNRIISFNSEGKRRLKRLGVWIRAWRQLFRLRKEYKLLGLFSFWCTEPAFVGEWFSRMSGLKHYIWVTGQDARKGNKYVKLIRPKAENLVAMSDFLAEEFYTNYGMRPRHMIPNGVDESLFPKAIAQKDIDIFAAGSLIPLKQYDIFLRVVSEVMKVLPNLKALHCGGGPQEEEMRTKARKLLGDDSLFTGEVSHAQTLEAMQRAKIFMHPSSYEGFSTVCLEALYVGAHVISFCRPLKREVKHWHIVYTPEEMLRKTLELLQDPATEYSSVCVYSMDENAHAVMRLFS